MDVLLTAQRDQAAAQRFFRKALSGAGHPSPRVINMEQNAADPPAVKEWQAEGVLSRRGRLRPCKLSHHIVEQDHRTRKRRTRGVMGYGSFRTAGRTLPGIETMHMLGKGRVRRVPKGDVVAPVWFLHQLFGWPTELHKT
jgi:IS6 family transposase